mgnify:CR=1 FL=1
MEAFWTNLSVYSLRLTALPLPQSELTSIVSMTKQTSLIRVFVDVLECIYRFLGDHICLSKKKKKKKKRNYDEETGSDNRLRFGALFISTPVLRQNFVWTGKCFLKRKKCFNGKLKV